MSIEDFLEAALWAIGGLDRVLAVRTFRARMRREPGGGSVQIARAAGGRIRVDERSAGRARSVVVNGERGWELLDGAVRELPPGEVAAIRREARIAPRNLLAHAGEYELALAETGETLTLSFPAERVEYEFDPDTLLCTRLRDAAAGRSVLYGDFREVAGLTTAFLERITPDAGDAFELVYESAAYNESIDQGLFAPPASAE